MSGPLRQKEKKPILAKMEREFLLVHIEEGSRRGEEKKVEHNLRERQNFCVLCRGKGGRLVH